MHRPRIASLGLALILAVALGGCDIGGGTPTRWGLATPERIAGFTRVEVARAESPEGGMTAGYQLFLGNDPVVATIRVRPAPASGVLLPSLNLGGGVSGEASSRTLEASIAQVRRFFPTAEVVERADILLVKQGALQTGRSAVLKYRVQTGGQEQTMRLKIDSFCCAGGSWVYEYRFRAKDGVDDDASVAAFLRESSWTAPRP